MTDYSYSGNELEQAQNAVNWKAYFRSRIGRYVTGRVLEVGAGLGGTTVRLRTPGVKEWVCLEPDPALAARLKATLAADRSAVDTRVVIGDLSRIPDSDLFDCILYIDVLEHIADDVAELQHASRHLAPGGALVVLCPAFQFLFSELDRAVGHYRRYTRRSLCSVFPSTMNRVEAFYLDSVGVIASIANKLLLRQGAPNEGQVKFWDGWIIPVSRRLDRLIGFTLGRSVIAVYRQPASIDATNAE